MSREDLYYGEYYDEYFDEWEISSKEMDEFEKTIYNKALEDFVKECREYKDLTFSEEHIERIKMIAEQLKR